jgi:hypothetical protein
MARRDSRVAITIRSGGGLFISENREKEKGLQHTLQQGLPRRRPSNRPYAQFVQPDQTHAACLQAQILACASTPTAILQADPEPLMLAAEMAIQGDNSVSRPVLFGRGDFHCSSIKRGIEQSTARLRRSITP